MSMSDRERMFAARKFFWEQMDKLDQVPSVEDAGRAIRKIAEVLPPFTRIVDLAK